MVYLLLLAFCLSHSVADRMTCSLSGPFYNLQELLIFTPKDSQDSVEKQTFLAGFSNLGTL